ncbi:hypothetical protein CRENBAI_012911 [Crenichthys baileyi]|uniref:Uncharacterized protein n=1 Tax=Crenichthys baileyi TaxID=28760 RepID=A0AAV9SMC7_9TELE
MTGESWRADGFTDNPFQFTISAAQESNTHSAVCLTPASANTKAYRSLVRGLSKQINDFDNYPEQYVVLEARLSACIQAAIQLDSHSTIVVVRKLGGSLVGPLHPIQLREQTLSLDQVTSSKG